MTPSIHLVRLRVSGWKGIKEPAEISFEGRSWFIHGSNEAGKSSFFSALRFALFEYSDKGGTFSDGWVNSDAIQAEVEVELLVSGEPYTIKKIRDAKKKGRTTLWDGIGANKRERSEKNKDADHVILELVGATKRSGREQEAPSNWGILAWLLAPQAVDTVSEAREHSTQALGLGRAISEDFQEVQRHVSKLRKETYGKGGSPLKSSPLREAQDDVESLEKEEEGLLRQRQEFEERLLRLRSLGEQRPVLEQRHSEAQESYETARAADVSFATDEEGLNTLDAQIAAKQAEFSEAEIRMRTLVELDEEIADAQTKVTEKTRSAHTAAQRHEAARAELEHITAQIGEFTARRTSNEELIKTNERLLRQHKHLEELRAAQLIVEELEEWSAELAKLTEGSPPLTSARIDDLLQLATKLELADSYLVGLAEERAMSVSLKGSLDATWVRDGEVVEPANEMGFASELEVRAEGFTMTVRSNGSDDGMNWVQRRLELRQELTEAGHKTSEDLREAMRAERERLERSTVLIGKIEAHPEIVLLTAERDRLRSLRVDVLPADTPPVETLEVELSAVQQEDEQAREEQLELSRKEAETGKSVENAREHLAAVRAELKSATDHLSRARERRDVEVGRNGVRADREARVQELEAALNARTKERAASARALNAEKGTHQEELGRLRKVVKLAEKDLRDCEADIKSVEREADAMGGLGLQSSLIAARDRLLDARSRHARLLRRGEAIRRLDERLEHFLVVTTDLETAPIRDRVQEWLRFVTDGHWTRIEMDSRLEVTQLDGRPPAIDGESMGSVGLRQVIHALTRLAVAAKIHGDARALDPEYPAVAIVMDESQSHVDGDRVKRLMHVFNEQIEQGTVQVIALSHRRNEFQNLNAMNYDISRREAYDLEEA
jgi:ABC-type molybdenum transport system ATPase subunit/photorepair protein PhrA